MFLDRFPFLGVDPANLSCSIRFWATVIELHAHIQSCLELNGRVAGRMDRGRLAAWSLPTGLGVLVMQVEIGVGRW